MSFGFSIGDVVLLSQLAWRTVEGARSACGEHAELTREVVSLHHVIQRVSDELSNVDSLLNRVEAHDGRRKELDDHINGCRQVLEVVDTILTKYNALGEDKRNGKKLWQKIKFGNGETKDLAEIRLKILTHTAAITLSLNLFMFGSQGRAEKQLESQGGDLKGIRESVNWIYAKMASDKRESSIMTSYTNDDKTFWRDLRRELVKDGYSSSSLRRHKGLIKRYMVELGDRGILDDQLETTLESCESTSNAIIEPAIEAWAREEEHEEISIGKTPLPNGGPDAESEPTSRGMDSTTTPNEPASRQHQVHVEDVVDEEFVAGAHINVEPVDSASSQTADSDEPQVTVPSNLQRNSPTQDAFEPSSSGSNDNPERTTDSTINKKILADPSVVVVERPLLLTPEEMFTGRNTQEDEISAKQI